MDYKELIEEAKRAAEKWAEKHPITGVGELRVDWMVADLTRAMTELLARAETAEKERDAAQSIIAQDIGVTGVDEIKTCFGYPLEKVQELVEADKAGCCIILDQDTVLSILAGASAIRQNNRLCLSTYLFDMKKKYGGPFQIDYIVAEENLRKIGYAALKGEKDG